VSATTTRPLGFQEVAELLNVKDTTVRMWKYHGQLPPADFIVHGMMAWETATIIRWAGETGRIHDPKLAKTYRKLTGSDPKPPRVARAVS
jgi:hypothetical protein